MHIFKRSTDEAAHLYILCAFEENKNLPFLTVCLCSREQQCLITSLEQEVVIQPLEYVTVSHVVLPVNELGLCCQH